jgi:hypothetical protein
MAGRITASRSLILYIRKRTKIKSSATTKKKSQEYSPKFRRKKYNIFTKRIQKEVRNLNDNYNSNNEANQSGISYYKETFDDTFEEITISIDARNSQYFNRFTILSMMLLNYEVEKIEIPRIETELRKNYSFLVTFNEADQLLTTPTLNFPLSSETKIPVDTFVNFECFIVAKDFFLIKVICKRILSNVMTIGKKGDYEARTCSKMEYENLFLTRRAIKELSGLFLRSLDYYKCFAKLAGFITSIGPHSRCTNWPTQKRALSSSAAASKLRKFLEYWERPCSTFSRCRSESSALPPVIGNGFRCISSCSESGSDPKIQNSSERIAPLEKKDAPRKNNTILIFIEHSGIIKAIRTNLNDSIVEITIKLFGRKDWNISC